MTATGVNKVLLISGHPRLDNSLANRMILADLEAKLGATLTVRRLDVLYPDGRIDIAAEQAALIEADTIVWQFPLYWYALPALMKAWVDEVLLYGFAHGQAGDKLQGKGLILSFTAGAPGEAYAVGQRMNRPIEEFVHPLHQTALLCGLDWQTPVYSTGMTLFPDIHGPEDRAKVIVRAHDHADELIARIYSSTALRQAT